MIIDVVIVVVLVFLGCRCPPFIFKGVRVIRKVSKSIIIIVIVGFYL
jgi:hypothetical protein